MLICLCLHASWMQPQQLHLFHSFNYRSLAIALTKDCPTDSAKAARIFWWITHHIKYDVKTYVKQKNPIYSPNKILRRRKAVCYGYSRLFNDMCSHAGITSAVILGYDKGWLYDFGDVFFTDEHAWSAYRTGVSWHLSDLTWASGYLYVKHGPLRRMLHKLRLLKFPFKIKFKKQYDPSFINVPPKLFIADHLPVVNYWQLLDKPVSLSDYENFCDTPFNHGFDSIMRSRSAQPACADCDAVVASGFNQQMQSESKKQLDENVRNTFFYLNTVYNSMLPFKKQTLADSVKVKEQLSYYNDLYTLTLCNMDNIRMDYELNRNQEKHKLKLFKAYHDSLAKFLKTEQQTRQRLKKQVAHNSRFARRLHIYTTFKMNRLMASGLQGVVTKPALSEARRKRKHKRMVKAETDAGKCLDRFYNDLFSVLNEADALDTMLVEDAINYKAIARELAAEQSFSQATASMREGFSDHYDLGVILSADSAAAHGSQAYQLFRRHLTRRMRASTKSLHKESKSLRKGLSELQAVKKNIRIAARNDVQLKSWREGNKLLDSLILLLKDSLNKNFQDYMRKMGGQKQELRRDWFLLRHVGASLSTEYFFESCRYSFYTTFYKRRYKKQLLYGKLVLKRVSKERDQLNKNLASLRR